MFCAIAVWDYDIMILIEVSSLICRCSTERHTGIVRVVILFSTDTHYKVKMLYFYIQNWNMMWEMA